MSIAAAFAADKETPFRAAPAASYEHRQTNGKITIAVDSYQPEEKMKTAFGKLKLNDYDIWPVLLVIQNDSDKSIRLDRMKVDLTGPSRNRVEATPARDVRYANGPGRPPVLVGPKGPVAGKPKKNPLDAWEIDGRAFAAQVLPPGQSAYGFFYFHTESRSATGVYVSGLYEAGSGNELFYFEIPLR